MAMILPKLAIGASWNPDVFDKTAILNLCWGDPGVGPPPNGPLVKIGFHDIPVPVFDLRQVADLNAPRRFKRTGYGTKLRFELELVYETTAGEPFDPYGLGGYGAEGTDASLLGNSTPGVVGTAFTNSPPYLFLSTTYQTFAEQWIPVEMDPDDGSPPTVDLGPKTILRTMSFALVSRYTYRRVVPNYIPSSFIRLPASSKVLTVSYPPTGVGPFSGSVTFSTPLDPIVQTNDAILVWFLNQNGIVGGPYRWERWQLTSIAGNRLSANIIASTAWPGPINPGTPTAPGIYKTQTVNELWRMPLYGLTPYAGTVIGPGMTPNGNGTQLIGGLA
jgi:hypothetical protein